MISTVGIPLFVRELNPNPPTYNKTLARLYLIASVRHSRESGNPDVLEILTGRQAPSFVTAWRNRLCGGLTIK
ncbi:MAG: hypothetical protein K9K75_04310 [Deltaproteobacteria bacterium]|nr:hypothetical protein [Deltaproteobacteria bacterium]